MKHVETPDPAMPRVPSSSVAPGQCQVSPADRTDAGGDALPTAPSRSDASGIELRPAHEGDLLAAARLRARSWQESFAGFLPARSLHGFADSVWTERLVEEWRALIAGGGVVWLAVRDGELVGLAQAERDDAPDAPAPMKLSKLYVLEKAKGTGLGARLFDCAVGSGAAYLWVLEDNTHARAFYERRGFIADGTAQHLLDDLAHVREIRMVRQRGVRPQSAHALTGPEGSDLSPRAAAGAENSVETAGVVVDDGRPGR